jgi:WD40 repeat protein
MQSDGRVGGAVFNHDDTRIISWSKENTARVWDVATHNQVGSTLSLQRGIGLEVNGAAFSANGKALFWSEQGMFSIWDFESGAQSASPFHSKNSDQIQSIFSVDRDRTRILVGTLHLLYLLDTESLAEIDPPLWLGEPVDQALLSGDGSHVLTVSGRSALRLWDVAPGSQIGWPLDHGAPLLGARFNEDESRILTWSENHTVRLWDTQSGLQTVPKMDHDGEVYGATLSPDEKQILSWSDDHTVRLWNAETGGEVLRINHDGPVGAFFSRDGARIISYSGNELREWDRATGRQIGLPMKHGNSSKATDVTFALSDKDEITYSALSPDGKRMVSLFEQNGGGTLNLWDAESTSPIGNPLNRSVRFFGATFNNSGTRILCWSEDGKVQLLDATTGSQIGPSMQTPSATIGARFLRNDTQIVAWSSWGIRSWEVGTGADSSLNITPFKGIRGASFSPDESRILTWSTDGYINVWDAKTGDQIGPKGTSLHHEKIVGASFNWNATRFLSWSYDHSLLLWDMEGYAPIGPILKHRAEVTGALLYHKDTRILSWSSDGTTRRWNIDWPQGNLLRIACSLLPKSKLDDVSERYKITSDPICTPKQLAVPIDWSRIQN